MENISPFANYSPATRGRIVGLLEAGFSPEQTRDIIGCNIKTVKLWYSRYRHDGISGLVDHRKNNHCPRKTTPDEDREILMIAQQNPYKSAENIQKRAGVDVSSETTRRRLKENNIVSHSPLKKPELTDRHRRDRISFAHENLQWSEEQWHSVIYSDESRFSTAMDGRLKVWRPRGEALNPLYVLPDNYSERVSTMFWGCMSSKGLMALHECSHKMNGEKYIEILTNVMLPAARLFFPEERYPFINFMHDNSSVHTCYAVKDWFVANPEIILQEHPAKSPDLNPIENIWGLMSKRWRTIRRLKNKDVAECVKKT